MDSQFIANASDKIGVAGMGAFIILKDSSTFCMYEWLLFHEEWLTLDDTVWIILHLI